MPLPKRIIEPVHITRNTLPDPNVPGIHVTSELEAVANGSLANIIRQLSSLSRHAEDLFVELSVIATNLFDRTSSLSNRINRLSIKVTALDSNVEEVSLQDIHMRKAFKSAVVIDQQLFTKRSLPISILEIYEQCDEPPPLNLLNCYRDDGKDGLKFYTDPNYFFELWRQEMLNDTERKMHDKGKKIRPKNVITSAANEIRHKKRVRQPYNTRERQKQIAMTQGEYIMSSTSSGQQQQQQQQNYGTLYYATLSKNSTNNNTILRPNSIEIQQQYIYMNHTNGDDINNSLNHLQISNNNSDHYQRSQTRINQDHYMYQQQSQESIYGSNQIVSPSRKVRPSQPPPAPPSSHQAQSPSINTPNKIRTNRENLPPPPPPPYIAETQNDFINETDLSAFYYDEQDSKPSDNHLETPPPPPPPPPLPLSLENNNTTIAVGKISNGDLLKTISALSPPKLRPVATNSMAPDPRNELLQAIRNGIKLRKVEKSEQKSASMNAPNNGLHDVASILARRVAVEYSDSDTSSQNDDDSDYDSECWAADDPRTRRSSMPNQTETQQQQQQSQVT